MQINLLELMSTLIPSIIAVVAIIVPAIQTLQLKKLELLEKQQEHLSAALTEAYVDFCSGFVRFQSGISDGAIMVIIRLKISLTPCLLSSPVLYCP